MKQEKVYIVVSYYKRHCNHKHLVDDMMFIEKVFKTLKDARVFSRELKKSQKELDPDFLRTNIYFEKLN